MDGVSKLKPTYVVIDDALSDDQNKLILQRFTSDVDNRPMPTAWRDYSQVSILHQLVDIARNYFDLSSMIGFEYWSQNQSKPGDWHIDKDEMMFQETGVVSTPLCTIAYYPIVDIVSGGRFISKDLAITPKTNRLLMFDSTMEHMVEDYTGRRVSVLIAPWDRKVKDLDLRKMRY